MSIDPHFIPTKYCRKPKGSHDVVIFESRKPKEKKIQQPQEEKDFREVIDMKSARFELYKFSKTALHGESKVESNKELAIRLGARPPKKKGMNYKQLKEEKAKQAKAKEEQERLNNIFKRQGKKKEDKIKEKRRVASGILNRYGKVLVWHTRTEHPKLTGEEKMKSKGQPTNRGIEV